MEKVKGILRGMSNMTQSMVMGVVSALTSFTLMVGVINTQNIIQENVSILEVYAVPMMMSLIAGFLTFFAWWLGKVTSEKMGFNLSIKMSKIDIKTNIGIGIVLGILTIMISEVFYMVEYPSSLKVILDGVVFILYGFFEEVLFRLGLIGLLSYGVYKVIYKENEKGKDKSKFIGFLWVVLFVVALTMNDADTLVGMDNVQVGFAIFNKLAPAITFSWLFYTKGFFHSVLAHTTMEVVINFILIPLLTIIR